jgi:hypothetical protein
MTDTYFVVLILCQDAIPAGPDTAIQPNLTRQFT